MPEMILAVIPIRSSDEEFRDGPSPMLGDRPLLDYTLRAAKEARLVDRVVVSTDSEAIAEVCRSYGVEVPFIRPPALSQLTASVTDVLRHCVEWLQAHEGYHTDWVVKLEITHPFRPPGLIDLVIETALAKQVDCAFVAYEELHAYWTLDEAGRPHMVGQDIDVPRAVRRPFYRDLSGLVSLTRATNLRAGKLYGTNIGLIPLRDLFAIVDLHEKGDASEEGRIGLRLAELLASEFNKRLAQQAPGQAS